MNFQAVLFDCDGVLVDSEPIVNRVLFDMLQDLGWSTTPLTREAVDHYFTGRTIRDVMLAWAHDQGNTLPADWMDRFLAQRNAALTAGLEAIPGIHGAVEALHTRLRGQIACASGADRFKIELQLRQVGLLPWFEGRIFSGHEVVASKPEPHVYLAAAAHLGVAPADCLVIEDSAIGARAGLAAGATVWGYCPAGHGRAFEGLPVQRVFQRMGDLPALVAAS